MAAACLAAIAELGGTDKELAQTLHQLVQQHPPLKAKTWYGMPANLDIGSFWPTSFTVTALDDRSTEHLVGLLQQATC